MADLKDFDWYYITPNTYVVEPVEYNGKSCSRVYDKFEIFYIDKKPLKLLNDTFRKLGTTYKASMDFSKRFLGKGKHKVPIVLSYDQPYVFLPVLSPSSSKNIWIAQHAIINIRKGKDGTIITLKNEVEIELPIHYTSFCAQYACATMLLKYALKQRKLFQRELDFLDDPDDDK
ncbi:MAG: competence protein ComK [Bacilli bacterium]|jgi:competence protein ComK|uniref:Competence protein ComK n=1 Tax=Ureibacillus suwonensis TaxID=313007 RepID=A0ABW0R8J3_9BACL|nr:hypothetical protein [Bacilli bacterium]